MREVHDDDGILHVPASFSRLCGRVPVSRAPALATETVAFKTVFYSVGDVGASVLRVKKRALRWDAKLLRCIGSFQ